MSKLSNITFDPSSPESISEALTKVIRVVDSELGFGAPHNPNDDTDAALAGTTHNGTPDNMDGSWVDVQFAAADTAVAFTHNLDLDFESTTSPNVVWIVENFKHSGAGPATGNLSIEFDDALCTVARSSIELVLRSPGTRTIGAGANAVRCRVFFQPVMRWT